MSLLNCVTVCLESFSLDIKREDKVIRGGLRFEFESTVRDRREAGSSFNFNYDEGKGVFEFNNLEFF